MLRGQLVTTSREVKNIQGSVTLGIDHGDFNIAAQFGQRRADIVKQSRAVLRRDFQQSAMSRNAIVDVHSRFNSHFRALDRKSTRLNSSHVEISYAVFCLK